MLKAAFLLILQDWLSEKRQTHWKKEMFGMCSRVEGQNLVCVDDLHPLLAAPWVLDAESGSMSYMSRKVERSAYVVEL
jgi:hypothetical protein